ncbi:hypothetical protein ACFZCP_44190 [Streptomyces sp. NPDC007971]|uniref:hypothetical protein n=1 Tax=Streptomyces sp. NPDC007971 TaxID=3364799 RepID=UPI0036E4079B
MEDLGVGADASGFDEPLVDGCGDVAAGGVDSAGEVDSAEAAALGGAVGAFFGVIGALDDASADAG